MEKWRYNMSNDFGQEHYFSIELYFMDTAIKRIASVLDAYAQNQVDTTDINAVLELYNIKLFFEKIFEVPEWGVVKYEEYKRLAKDADKIVTNFYVTLTENSILEASDNCNSLYNDDFWMLLCRYKSYKRIRKENFVQIIQAIGVSPYKILEDREFVNHFDSEVAQLLKKPEYGVRILIDLYLENHTSSQKIYLPNSLTAEDKKTIIAEYLGGEHVNLKSLELIMNSQYTRDFPLDDRIRFQAKKRYKEMCENPNMYAISHKVGVNVSIAPDLPIADVSFEDGIIKAEYDAHWIKENLDYATILNNFIYLFGYTDIYMRCQFTSISSNLGTIEAVFLTNGKKMYKHGQSFNMMNMLADAQMHVYYDILKKQKIYLENVVKWFFEDYLIDEFGAEGFICNVPSGTASFLDKCKLMASAMDGIVKQYQMFLDDGEIDREFYEMFSGSIRYKALSSFVKNKYAYANNDNIKKEMHLLFSDQSGIFYIEKTKEKYRNFFDLVTSEHIVLSDFYPYQRIEVDWLIERGAIKVEVDVLSLNVQRANILEQLYRQEVLCLQYVQSEIVRDMIKNNEIIVENTLLSKLEYQYIDYILNKAEFSNGLDLRNKYIHDTGSIDIKQQEQDYIVLLKVMILLIIKINEEFCFRDRIKEGESDFYEL